MKHFYIFLSTLFLFLAFPGFSNAQGFGLPLGFNVKDFQKTETQAIWFTECDSAMSRAIVYDHIPASKDVFCYPDKRGWKVVAGTADSSGMKDASYYFVDNKKEVSVIKKTDTAQVAAYARALYNSKLALAKLNIRSGSGWKKFVQLNADLTITVWAFCNEDDNGNIWYGPECAWYYTSDGRKLVTSKIINKSPMMAGKAGSTLNLMCPADKMPTVGTVFIAQKYRQNFEDINISYKTGTSTLHHDESLKTYAWEHVGN